MKKTKSQVSMEFILTTGLVVFILLSIIVISSIKTSETRTYERINELRIPCLKIANEISNVYNTGENTKLITNTKFNFTLLGANRQIIIWKNDSIPRYELCSFIPFNVTTTYNTSATIERNTNFIIENHNNSIEIRPAWMDKNLVAWFTIQDQNNTHLIDRSGFYNDAKKVNDTNCFADGYRFHGCKFNGFDNYLKIPDINLTPDFSVSFWVKSNNSVNYPGQQQFLSKTGVFWLGTSNLNNNQIFFQIFNETNNPKNVFYTINNPGEWQFITGTINDSNKNINLYVNGAQVRSDTFTGTLKSNNENIKFGIMELNHLHERSFNGTVDDIRIYNRTLSKEEIQYLYNFYNSYIKETNGEILK